MSEEKWPLIRFCSSGTTFSEFSESKDSAPSAGSKFLDLGQKESRALESAREALTLQMSKHDPSFGSLKGSGFDPAALFRRLDGDIELLRDLLHIFSEESPLLLEKISVAIQQGAFEEVRRLSHKLKGTALQFSSSGVATLAGSLEDMGAHRMLEGAARIFSDLEREVASLERSLQTMARGEGWHS